MESTKIKKIDKLYLFYERHFNNIIALLIFIVPNVFYWLKHFRIGPGDKITGPFVTDILTPREGIIVTVAAVFIGIYFTVISILGAIKVDSTLALLPKTKFFKLVTFLRNGFIFSLSYLILTVFFPWLSDKLTDYKHYLLYLLLIILFFYMFLTSLKVGLALFLVFKSDFANLHQEIEKEKKETENQAVILKRLEKFLDENDDKKAIKNAIDMNEAIKRKNPPKK
jgi:hypothetical protein